MDLSKLNKATEKAKQTATDAAKRIQSELSVLSGRFVCPDCEVACEASEEYDPAQAAFYAETNGKVPSWRCPECETHYRREENSVGFDPYER